MANFMAVLTARRWFEDRQAAIVAPAEAEAEEEEERAPAYVVYTSVGAHRCIQQAVAMAGIQSGRSTATRRPRRRVGGLRKIAVGVDYRMSLALLEEEIVADLAAGLVPLLVVAAAGTVDVGAIDDLPGIARLCERFHLWFHVDGAYGALGVLSSHVRPLLSGIELAHSIAFDFHKWGQVLPARPALSHSACLCRLSSRCNMTQGC
jgi:aromatic-L-amino-acid/L-tryptophan decarboxylase